MKNSQRGFIVPLLVGIVALLVLGGGTYIYLNQQPKTLVTSPVENNTATTSDSFVGTNSSAPTLNISVSSGAMLPGSITSLSINKGTSINPNGPLQELKVGDIFSVLPGVISGYKAKLTGTCSLGAPGAKAGQKYTCDIAYVPSSSENISTDGYFLNYDYQINSDGSNGKLIGDYLFKTKGQKIIIPTNISAVFDGNIRTSLTGGTQKGESLSSHYFLSNPADPSTLFFSTDDQEWTDTSCKITSSIYRYNISKQVVSKIFSQSQSGPAYSCKGLRPIGVQGTNLLLYKTSTDNSPGPCFDPLINFNKQSDSLLSLNIDKPSNGVVSYTPSATVVDIASKKEKECIANLANI